ncbi:uncharacterized protein ofcc1 isoform X3 [Dunckerocampus dactyliophorus]|uniref:uncharacterized protein ofcc1 isoform X3 n=1 Tax=Dunckerocampus dactyliophorus TaxID=161453 RepID=UPI0024063DF4|nr:uncharacterized protein ofcc1 isoform X3 [Dunckerocampus dactyliophorus]
MELQAPAKERGNECARNYFDPASAEKTDPRLSSGASGVDGKDELELTTLNATENGQRRAVSLYEDDTFIDIPGAVVASGDGEVLEVKAGNPVLLHSGGGGGGASGAEPSQASTTTKTEDGPGTGHGGDGVRGVMSRESAVKTKTTEEVVPRHALLLRERARPDMITLGSLSLQQQAAEKTPRNWSQWAKMKRRLMAVFSGNVVAPHPQSREAAREATRRRHNTLPRCSSTADSPSHRALGEGQEAISKYGQMTELSESSSSVSQSLWQVHHNTTPQPVDVCVRCLRATRDKLPRGLYSISVALHSRLGGPALAWNNTKAQQEWMVSTDPVEHQGHSYDIDLHINQNVAMILPPTCKLLPSMVLVFQLIAAPGQSSYMKSVLAWGAFPVCGPRLGLVQGRYKTPLLRGEPNCQVDQFRKIEALMSSDLDHWLCNMYFQIKARPAGASRAPECSIPLQTPPLNASVMLQPVVRHSQPRCQHDPQASHPQSQLNPLHAGTGSGAGEPAVIHSPQGSPFHLSADSTCSSSLPGKGSSPRAICGNAGAKSHPRREKEELGLHCKKEPIKKTNSRGPSVSGRSRSGGGGKHTMHKLSVEEMEEYTFSLLGPGPSQLSDPTHLALRMLPSELGLPLPRQQQHQQQQQMLGRWMGSVWQLGLIMLLLTLMWFVRLYLHYCSQWLYLQAIAVPVNKFQFHAHTVDLVYQSSLLHTREELAMVVLGPLTLNAVTFLLVLIRWGCQQIFGSLPSFTSKFIMAQGVWTVLHPLAVLAVDAVLGRLTYSPDRPVGDAAKLFWHFRRVDQSGAAGVIITVFLYAVIFLLSITIVCIYLLRFHNDGRMLDVYQRLTAKEGTYFLPQDLELSNQELSYIVKKAEQWRGFNGERRKVAVYDYIWTAEDPLAGSATAIDDPRTSPPPEGETSTHVAVYTLYVSGLKQRYRHFLRQPDGAIIEVIGDLDGFDNVTRMAPIPAQVADQEGAGITHHQLRKRKKLFGRCPRVEPVGGSRCDSGLARDLNQ